MSNLKRLLALTIAIVMIVGGMASTVSAKPFADIDKKDQSALYNALNLLNDLGIVKGVGEDEDGNMIFNINEDDLVTRQQFALFVARIRSATPEYFVPDAAAEVEAFTDCKDPTYFTAINYCYENGIVEGVGGGLFAPEAPIRFQDAVKMLVTALGYTGLSYPVGFLSKAAEAEVALLGAYVEESAFTFTGKSAVDNITRNEMGMLLYNFLLSNYNYLDMVWNAVDTRYESRPRFDPVINKFGIQRITGYVTGITGFAADLLIRDYNDTGAEVLLTGNKIAKKWATSAVSEVQRDIEISYANVTGKAVEVERPIYAIRSYAAGEPIVGRYYSINGKSTGPNGTGDPTDSPNYISTTVVGYDKETVAGYTTHKLNGKIADFAFADVEGVELTDRDLLGLKVRVYRDVRTNPAYPIALPASRVVGTKEEVDVTKTDAKFSTKNITTQTTVPTNRVDGVDSITLNGTTYDQKSPADLVDKYNVYSFTDKGYLTNAADRQGTNPERGAKAGISTAGSKDEDNLMKLLARFAKDGKPNFKLEYVYNGKSRNDGIDEFYYVLTPFRVGTYYAKGGNNYLDNDYEKDAEANRVNHASITVTDVTEDASIGTLVAGDAYLYTVYGEYDTDFGKYIDLYGKLTKSASNVVVEAIATNSAVFTTNITVTTGYATTASRAIGALNLAWSDFGARNTYNLYKDSSDRIMFAFKTAKYEAPGYAPRDYGIIIDKNPGAHSSYLGGRIGFTVEIFNASRNAPETLLVSSINGTNNPATGTNIALLKEGDYISFEQTSTGGYNIGWYDVTAVTTAEAAVAAAAAALAALPAGDPGIAAAQAALAARIAERNSLMTGSIGKLHASSGEYGAFIPGAITANADNRLSSTGVLRLDNGVVSPATLTVDNAKNAIITSSTKIILYSDRVNGPGTPGTDNLDPGAKLISLDTFRGMMDDTSTLYVGFIARQPVVGNANVVYVKTTEDLDAIAGLPTEPERYGYVIDNAGQGTTGTGGGLISNSTTSVTYTDAYGNKSAVSGNALYYTNSAIVYNSAGVRSIVNVASESEFNTFAGNFVRVTNNYITTIIGGTSVNYYLVETVDSLLSKTGFKQVGAGTNGETGEFNTGDSGVAAIMAAIDAGVGATATADANVIRYTGTATIAYHGNDSDNIDSISIFTTAGVWQYSARAPSENLHRLLVIYGATPTAPAVYGDKFTSRAPATDFKGLMKLEREAFNKSQTAGNNLKAVMYVNTDGILLGVTFIVNRTGATNITWDKDKDVWGGWAKRP